MKLWVQQMLVHFSTLAIGILLVIFIIVPIFQGCDTAQGSEYKVMYERQVVITDSIKTVLMDSINLLSLTANRKIDSLKSVESGLRYQLAHITPCDTVQIWRDYFRTQLDPYLFIPLNQRLNEIVDSLNRK